MFHEQDRILSDLVRRNQIRQAAGLPILNIKAEIAKTADVQNYLAFQRAFDAYRMQHRNCHHTGSNWLSKMGRWSWSRREFVEAVVET